MESQRTWERREEWINEKIAETWKDRGAFPGVGAALESLGIRLGTALALELLSRGIIKPTDDPWPALDALLVAARRPNLLTKPISGQLGEFGRAYHPNDVRS